MLPRRQNAGYRQNECFGSLCAKPTAFFAEMTTVKRGWHEERETTEIKRGRMVDETIERLRLERDILELDIATEVLAVLLKDSTTGRNLICATDDYTVRGKGFAQNVEILLEQIVDKSNPVIRPRVDKTAEGRNAKIIVRAMRANGRVTILDLCRKTRLSTSGVYKIIAALKAASKSRRIGPTKGGSWEVVE